MFNPMHVAPPHHVHSDLLTMHSSPLPACMHGLHCLLRIINYLYDTIRHFVISHLTILSVELFSIHSYLYYIHSNQQQHLYNVCIHHSRRRSRTRDYRGETTRLLLILWKARLCQERGKLRRYHFREAQCYEDFFVSSKWHVVPSS